VGKPTLRKIGRNEAKTPFDFEAAMKRLEEIAAALEQGELPLAELEARFTEGMQLARACEARLSEVEQRVELLLQFEGGEVERSEFDENDAQ